MKGEDEGVELLSEQTQETHKDGAISSINIGSVTVAKDSGWNFVLGKVAEGSGDVMEVVEWPGMEERWEKNVWREIRVLG
uniref:Uncharacterized protein n=1 Tax=Tanacetum cinerariifolium TaxID=118510 RepID=A0A699K234_TANCI|nr:hypothetical protein [Tanacetum cinerariifolium]